MKVKQILESVQFLWSLIHKGELRVISECEWRFDDVATTLNKIEIAAKDHELDASKQFSDVTTWQNETFPQSTAMSKIAHLEEEVTELSAAIEHDLPEKRLEFADCFILLFGAAAADGMTYKDIYNAISEKMEINRSRNWGEPDENGVVKHIQ